MIAFLAFFDIEKPPAGTDKKIRYSASGT